MQSIDIKRPSSRGLAKMIRGEPFVSKGTGLSLSVHHSRITTIDNWTADNRQ